MAQTYTLTSPAHPGLTPPPGVIPTFSSPFSMQPYNVLTIAACVTTTTILVAARMYTKVRIMKSTVWEDCKQRVHRTLTAHSMSLANPLQTHAVSVGYESPVHSLWRAHCLRLRPSFADDSTSGRFHGFLEHPIYTW